ncbi:MAG: zinc-ribbon domain-containing protein [Clostridium sp.]|nr:zinc-ribbon domain-containing protein [Clostridium sp.]
MLDKYLSMIRKDIQAGMKNRCGLDELNNLLMLIGFVFVVAALFTQKWILTLIGALFIVLCYLRVFSKNLDKRRNENAVYMKYMGNVVRFVEYLLLCVKMKGKSVLDKEYAYFVCSQCKQVIRVPKGKNKVSIRCPKCSHTFIKTT